MRALQPEEYGIAAAGCEIAVTDVVDEPGEAVDGHQIGPPGAGQEERCDREILVCGLIEHGARLLPPVTRRPLRRKARRACSLSRLTGGCPAHFGAGANQ